MADSLNKLSDKVPTTAPCHNDIERARALTAVISKNGFEKASLRRARFPLGHDAARRVFTDVQLAAERRSVEAAAKVFVENDCFPYVRR